MGMYNKSNDQLAEILAKVLVNQSPELGFEEQKEGILANLSRSEMIDAIQDNASEAYELGLLGPKAKTAEETILYAYNFEEVAEGFYRKRYNRNFSLIYDRDTNTFSLVSDSLDDGLTDLGTETAGHLAAWINNNKPAEEE